jgi:hypothetical protein
LRHFRIYRVNISRFIVESFLIGAIVIEIFMYEVRREESNLREITYLYINPLESRRFFNKCLISNSPLISKHLFVRGFIFSCFIYNNKIYKVARNY